MEAERTPAQYRIWGYHDSLKHCFQEYNVEKKAFYPNWKPKGTGTL